MRMGHTTKIVTLEVANVNVNLIARDGPVTNVLMAITDILNVDVSEWTMQILVFYTYRVDRSMLHRNPKRLYNKSPRYILLYRITYRYLCVRVAYLFFCVQDNFYSHVHDQREKNV